MFAILLCVSGGVQWTHSSGEETGMMREREMARKIWLEMIGEEDDGGEREEKKGRDCIYTCHFAPVPKSRGDITGRIRAADFD